MRRLLRQSLFASSAEPAGPAHSQHRVARATCVRHRGERNLLMPYMPSPLDLAAHVHRAGGGDKAAAIPTHMHAASRHDSALRFRICYPAQAPEKLKLFGSENWCPLKDVTLLDYERVECAPAELVLKAPLASMPTTRHRWHRSRRQKQYLARRSVLMNRVVAPQAADLAREAQDSGCASFLLPVRL